VPAFYLLFTNLMNAPEPVPGSGILGYIVSLPLMGKLLFGTFLISVPGILIWSYLKGSRQEFQMMLAAMVLIIFNVVFWTLFEQAGSSLTLFADRNTDLRVAGDFAMGVGVGFLFLVWGGQFAGADFKVALWWLAGLYLIHSVAELCISPVGLSMITKLSIARVVGLMMGVWFLSISVAQYVAGVVAQVASVETVGGQVTNLKVSLDTYNGVFTTIGWIAIGLGLLLLLLAWPLRKWMHGVK
jgi:POT family proton-dependent oligopeptide transporter